MTGGKGYLFAGLQHDKLRIADCFARRSFSEGGPTAHFHTPLQQGSINATFVFIGIYIKVSAQHRHFFFIIHIHYKWHPRIVRYFKVGFAGCSHRYGHCR